MYSIYTEYLQQLARHSRRLDNMSMTNNTFVEFQRLEAAIIDAHKKGYYGAAEEKQLATIATALHDKYRYCLDLNERVKAISKEITRQRRKEARSA